MKKIFQLILFFYCFSPLIAQSQQSSSQNGTLRVVFRNIANGRPIVLDSSICSNPFAETFKLTKLKYYISHFAVNSPGKKTVERNGYYLIDQSIDSSLSLGFTLPANSYDSIGFLIGVDSAMNSSGAQTGALDPLNDMFWTWNSGYIMFKIEGTSPQSSTVNNKIEYHIGGYRGQNNVLKYITLPFPGNNTLTIKKGETTVLVIDANLDKFWEGDTTIKILDTPVCTTPGSLAKQIAGNFSHVFSVNNIIQND